MNSDDTSKPFDLSPMDDFNRDLVGNVHPQHWKNPEPSGTYNLVVVGGGTAGLISAAVAAGMGAKTALIEKSLLGGDCLNVGCVPSKSLIRSARAVWEIQNAETYGVEVPEGAFKVNFDEVMKRMRRIRAGISSHDSAARFSELGADVYLGAGKFTGPNTLEVAGKTLRFKKAVITTGARAAVPDIEGLREAGYLTNENVFNLTECPKRLAVVGSGPIGCEMAQTFRRMGAEVTVLERGSKILSREDSDASEILFKQFEKENIQVLVEVKILKAEKSASGKVIHFESDGNARKIEVDEILIGAGRAPNVSGIGLEAAGVVFDEKNGVQVNDRLQTSQPHIYAAGDVCLKHKFTHTAEASAKIIIQNALFFGRKKFSALVIPWCTYTDPEIAHVGMNDTDARERGIETQTVKHELKDTDRAAAEGDTEGFVKMLADKKTGKILGATIVARHAGEMISEVTTVIYAGLKLGELPNIIHPYPTQAEAIKRTGDHFNKGRFKSWMKQLLTKWFAWRR